MGTDSDVRFSEDGEGPTREVTIDAFYLEVDSGVSAFRQRMGDGESMG